MEGLIISTGRIATMCFLFIFIVISLLVFIYWVLADSDILLSVYDRFAPNLGTLNAMTNIYTFKNLKFAKLLLTKNDLDTLTDWYGGKTVWITGASSGIGQQIAFQLAKGGTRLVLSARDHIKLEETRQRCIGNVSHHWCFSLTKQMLIICNPVHFEQYCLAVVCDRAT